MLDSLCQKNPFWKKHYIFSLLQALTKTKEQQYNIHTFEILPYFRVYPRYLTHPIPSFILNSNGPCPQYSILHTHMSDYPNFIQIYTDGSRAPVVNKSRFRIYITEKIFILLLELLTILKYAPPKLSYT